MATQKAKPAAGRRPAPKKKPPAAKATAEPAVPRKKQKNPPAKKKPKGKAVNYASAAALASYDAETAKEAALQGRQLDAFKDEWDSLKEEAGAKAKEYKAAAVLHFKYLRDRAQGRGKPPQADLFGDIPAGDAPARAFGQHLNSAAKKKPTKKKPAGGKAGSSPGSEGSADQRRWVPADLWRQYPMERLTSYGMAAGDVEKLKAGEIKGRRQPFPIVTMGDLSEFQEPIAGATYTRKLTDISGIGLAAAERIETACAVFWSNWSGGVGQFAESFAVEKGHKRPDGFAEEGLDDAGRKSGRAPVAGGKRHGDGDGEVPAGADADADTGDEGATLPFHADGDEAGAGIAGPASQQSLRGGVPPDGAPSRLVLRVATLPQPARDDEAGQVGNGRRR